MSDIKPGIQAGKQRIVIVGLIEWMVIKFANPNRRLPIELFSLKIEVDFYYSLSHLIKILL